MAGTFECHQKVSSFIRFQLLELGKERDLPWVYYADEARTRFCRFVTSDYATMTRKIAMQQALADDGQDC